jgi:hypothetical protein
MRIHSIFLLLIFIALSISQTACPAGNNNPPPSNQSAQTGDISDVDLTGDDPAQLVEEWKNLGQDPEYLIHLLDPDQTGQYPVLRGWYISGLSEWAADSWQIQLNQGPHLFIACGGDQIEDINIGISSESGMLGSDDEADKIPSVMITLENDTEVTVEVIPVSYVGDSTEGLYAMFYM